MLLTKYYKVITVLKSMCICVGYVLTNQSINQTKRVNGVGTFFFRWVSWALGSVFTFDVARHEKILSIQTGYLLGRSSTWSSHIAIRLPHTLIKSLSDFAAEIYSVLRSTSKVQACWQQFSFLTATLLSIIHFNPLYHLRCRRNILMREVDFITIFKEIIVN